MTSRDALRDSTARAAADALDSLAPDHLGACFVGFDGFTDFIVRAVDRRHGPDHYDPIRTIGAFAARCAAAGGRSTNIELVDEEVRWGGNGPLLAGALASLGIRTTYVGTVGREDEPGELDVLYQPLADVCKSVIPIGPPGRTEALEFDDGKLMFNRTRNVQAVTWEGIVERVGLARLRLLVEESALIGLVNWSLMTRGEEVWRRLTTDVLEHLAPGVRPRIFVDLSDPAKRTDDAIREALTALREMSRIAPVMLGLNLSEAERVSAATGTAFRARHIGDGAARLRARIGVECVVVHPRHGAGAATEDEQGWFDGPLTHSPRVSTGAGDHFNAGFAMARCAGLDLSGCLATGCATSGYFVRHGRAPSRADLGTFLRALPTPEGS